MRVKESKEERQTENMKLFLFFLLTTASGKERFTSYTFGGD